MIDCPMCGYKFEMTEAKRSCRGCPLAASCNLARCPRCSYEVFPEPQLFETIRTWRRKIGTRGKGRGATGDSVDKD